MSLSIFLSVSVAVSVSVSVSMSVSIYMSESVFISVPVSISASASASASASVSVSASVSMCGQIDNSANGLSLHPGGPVQEYLDHKGNNTRDVTHPSACHISSETYLSRDLFFLFIYVK